MILGVQGSSSFNDYHVFLRAMAVGLSGMPEDDEHFYIYTAGPANINTMVMEFVNVSEKGMKSRGKKIKMFKVAPEWLSENISELNYFAFLSKPGERYSKLVAEAKLNNIEVGTFNY